MELLAITNWQSTVEDTSVRPTRMFEQFVTKVIWQWLRGTSRMMGLIGRGPKIEV